MGNQESAPEPERKFFQPVDVNQARPIVIVNQNNNKGVVSQDTVVTVPIQNDFMILKDTMYVNEDKSISFYYTSKIEGKITIFFNCTEGNNNKFNFLGQTIEFHIEVAKSEKFHSECLDFQPGFQYPFIVQFRADNRKESHVHALSHYYTIPLKLVKSVVEVDETSFELKEIFGLSEQGECVICLTNPRNVSILPCRHCVFCSECAVSGKIKNCPICRCVIEKFLNIQVKNT